MNEGRKELRKPSKNLTKQRATPKNCCHCATDYRRHDCAKELAAKKYFSSALFQMTKNKPVRVRLSFFSSPSPKLQTVAFELWSERWWGRILNVCQCRPMGQRASNLHLVSVSDFFLMLASHLEGPCISPPRPNSHSGSPSPCGTLLCMHRNAQNGWSWVAVESSRYTRWRESRTISEKTSSLSRQPLT